MSTLTGHCCRRQQKRPTKAAKEKHNKEVLPPAAKGTYTRSKRDLRVHGLEDIYRGVLPPPDVPLRLLLHLRDALLLRQQLLRDRLQLLVALV